MIKIIKNVFWLVIIVLILKLINFFFFIVFLIVEYCVLYCDIMLI